MKTLRGCFSAVVLGLIVLAGLPALAESVTLAAVTGTWSNPEGPGVFTVIGTGTNEIRWGQPASASGQSGLRFDGSAPPPRTFNTGDLFDVGELTHFNNVINGGTGLTGAKLTVSLTFSDPLGLAGTFPFEFDINETPNTTGGPADNDIISFTSGVSSNTVVIGGTEYHLQLLGFTQGGSFVSQFSSPEGGANEATLIGRLTSDPSSGIPGVPLPGVAAAGFALMGGTGLSRRSRRRMF